MAGGLKDSVVASVEKKHGDDLARVFFFFQAEDGIRDYKVTGVQTCALPISCLSVTTFTALGLFTSSGAHEVFTVETVSLASLIGTSSASMCSGRANGSSPWKIGRASCRERV